MELCVFIIILTLIFYSTIPVKREEYINEEEDYEDAGIILMDDML